MKTRDDMITTRYFDSYPKDQGLVIDMAEIAEHLPEDAGIDYIAATDWRLTSTFGFSSSNEGPSLKELQHRRSIDAETHIIASYEDEPQDNLPDFGASGMIVKRVGDMHLALPEIFDFALGRVNVAANDALKLYGPELFKEAEMLLIVQRTDIEPQEAHRQPFASWHDHLSGGQNIDMIYSFSNTLGTESRLSTHKGRRIEPVEMTTPNARLMRIGGEVAHRSQRNESEQDIRREWGALTINIKPSDNRRARNFLSTNRTMVKPDDPNFGEFKAKAAKILGDDFSVQAYEKPKTLIEENDIDVEYIPQ